MPDTAELQKLLEFDLPGDLDSSAWAAAEGQCVKFPERFVEKCVELREFAKWGKKKDEEVAQKGKETDRFFHHVVRNLISIADNCNEAMKASNEHIPVAGVESDHQDSELPDDAFQAVTTEDSTESIETADAAASPSSDADAADDIAPEPAADDSQAVEAGSVTDLPATESNPPETTVPAASPLRCIEYWPSDADENAPGTEPDVGVSCDDCKPAQEEAEGTPEDLETGRKIEAMGLRSVHRSLLGLLEDLGVVPVDLIGHTYKDVVVDDQLIDDPFEIVHATHATQKGKATELKVREIVGDLWVLRKNGVKVLKRGRVVC